MKLNDSLRVVSYHYDMLMRLRKIRVKDEKTGKIENLEPVMIDGHLLLRWVED